MSEAERKSEHTPVSYTSEELIGAARFCFADPKYHNCFGCPLEHKPCDNLERLLANRLELCEFALRAQEQNEPLTECEFCLGCATEHGFYISKGALFYLDSQLGAEGIEIRYCPICGRNLNLCESEHAPLDEREHKEDWVDK